MYLISSQTILCVAIMVPLSCNNLFQSEQNLNEDNPEESILQDKTVPPASKDTSDKGELTS